MSTGKRQNLAVTFQIAHICCSLYCFLSSTETRREVPSEPQRADSLRVPCPSGARVQPAPARTRDHAALQTPAADLLALVTHQEDDRQVLLLILHFTQCPSSQLTKRHRWLSLSCSHSSLRSHTLLSSLRPEISQRDGNFQKLFCLV